MSSLVCVHCAVHIVYNVTDELSRDVRLVIRCVLCVELYLCTETTILCSDGAE